MGETYSVAGKQAPPPARYLSDKTIALLALRDAMGPDRGAREMAILRLTAMQKRRPDDYLAALRQIDPSAEVDDRPWERPPGHSMTGETR